MHCTKEEGEHRPVALGGPTGSAAATEHEAQPAGVRQQWFLKREIDPVPVARGHEAHEVGPCAGTGAVQVSLNVHIYEYFILFYPILFYLIFEITSHYAPTAPRFGHPRLLYQPSKRGVSQLSSPREPGQHTSARAHREGE